MAKRHVLKAVALVVLVALAGWLVPSWETVLTRPIGQWQQAHVAQEAIPAPELSEPAAPLRAAAQPPASPPVATPPHQETASDGPEAEAPETTPVEMARREAELSALLTAGDELVRDGVRLPPTGGPLASCRY